MWKSLFEADVICNILFKEHSSKRFLKMISFIHTYLHLECYSSKQYKNFIMKYLLRVYSTR